VVLKLVKKLWLGLEKIPIIRVEEYFLNRNRLLHLMLTKVLKLLEELKLPLAEQIMELLPLEKLIIEEQL
jgi:hypothetical protein